mgnify:CR=1 FL=1
MSIPITNKFFQETADNIQEAKRILVASSRILANEGVFDAFGHMSIRNPENPETFFMSRSVSPEMVTMDDIIELDQQGIIVNSPNPRFRPFGERFIHSAIYAARDDVNSICHPHPAELIPFASCDIPLRSIYHQDVTFYDGIDVFRDLPEENGCLINTLELGEKLAKKLGEKRGILIQNHGVVVVGESAARTVYSCITLRDNAKMLLQTLSMSPGNVYYISEEAAKNGMEKQFAFGLVRSWNYWCSHARESYPDLAEIIF